MNKYSNNPKGLLDVLGGHGDLVVPFDEVHT
jgi:hypothetical protein